MLDLGSRHSGGLLLVLLLINVLTACAPVQPSLAVPPTTPFSTIAASARPSSTPCPATEMPIPTTRTLPSPIPRTSAAPSTTPVPTDAPACALLPQETITATQTLTDLILFIGPHTTIGAMVAGALCSPARAGRQALVEQLGAISPDGRRAGRLTNDRAGVGYFASPAPPVGLLILSTQSLLLPEGPVRQAPLPAVCERPADLTPGAGWRPCSDFRFSADGRWAAFLQGADICGRGLVLLNLATGESQLLPTGHSSWLFQFLPSGRLLLTRGHCEGALAYLRDPTTGEEIGLGAWGREVWSPDGTALAVCASAYMGWESWVWGFDRRTEWRFLSPPGESVDDNLPLWTPDGTHLLYQHRALTYTQSTWPITVTFGPREVRLVDVLQGEERALLSDPAYDYHLGLGVNNCPWYGSDWLPLRRVPYRPQTCPSMEGADFQSPAVRCLLYGESCPDPVEQLVLNWRTGEVIPAGLFQSPTPVPSAVPTPAPTPGPDLETTPLYGDPAGRYSLYVGAGGMGLWCVPAVGGAVQWVQEGHDFFYVP